MNSIEINKTITGKVTEIKDDHLIRESVKSTSISTLINNELNKFVDKEVKIEICLKITEQ